MVGILDPVSALFGAPIWLIYVIVVWEIIWKLLALWKAAQHKHLAWFIVLGVVNTIGILPILYIYVFSKLHHPSFKKKKEEQKKVVTKKRTLKIKIPKRKK